MAYIKTFPIILIAVLALAIGIYYSDILPWGLNTSCATQHVDQPAQTITWSTYRNNQYGFTIKYPSVYSIDELHKPIQTEYYMYKFLSIVDPKDTCTYEFHVVPAAVAIIKQPIFKEKVFHNLEEYIAAGFGQGGDTRSKGELVSINGLAALHFHYRAVYMQEDAHRDQYVIIRDALIYQIDLKTEDPFREEFLRSFNLIEASGPINSGEPTTGPDRPANATPWTGGSGPK